MKGSLAARRYAKSLLSQALEKGSVDAVNADMLLVQQTIADSKELQVLLGSPIVKSEKKQDILKAVFAGKIDALTDSFIGLIAEKGRESKLAVIADAFIDAVKEYKKVSNVEVTSAVALNEDQKKKIIELIAKQGITNVDMQEKVDPALIGGFVVRFGDKQIDASVLRKLNNLKQDLVSN